MRPLHLIGPLALCLGVAPSAAWATVLEYSFPASWDDSVTTVTDLSSAGNNGAEGPSGGAATSTDIPPGAPAGTLSLVPDVGGLLTTATNLLDNTVVGPAGGFTMSAQFLWNGVDNGFGGVQKIVDYAGTESLQIEIDPSDSTVANLVFLLNDNDRPVSFPIVADTWYDATATFIVTGTDGSDLDGIATLTLDGTSTSAPASKTTFGDGFGRPIAIGQLALGGTELVELQGLVYDPSVALLPEPTTGVLLLSGLALGIRRRR